MLSHLFATGLTRPARLPNPAASLSRPDGVPAVPSRAALALAIAALLLTVLIGWLADGLMVRLLLDQAAGRAAVEVQLGLLDRVTPADFDPPFDADRLANLAFRLDPVIARVRGSDSALLRVNVIARDGTILFSDLAPIRGHTIRVSDKPELETALGGGIGADDAELDGQENADLRPVYGRALEVYVPVRLEGQVTGAYEIYEDVGQLHSARSLVWGVLGGLWCLAFAGWYVLRERARRPAAEAAPDLAATPSVEPVAVDRAAEPMAAANAERDRRVRLTPRELEVLRLMATSHTNRDIAEQLSVSEETVRSHVKRILHKLDQPDRTQAVLAAVRAGLLDFP
jgi:DNA-binding CsgD family transcriptional regulator